VRQFAVCQSNLETDGTLPNVQEKKMTRSNWKLCGLTLAIAAGLLAACGIPTATPEQCPREDFPYVTLQSPENGVTVNSLTPLFEWENSQGSCEPQEFSIDLALDSTFTEVILSDTTDGPYPGWTSTIELLDCTTYFWRVAPIVDGVRGEYSETHEFNVDVSGACNADASISGDIFHDLCAVPYASIPPGDPLPEGCIDAGPVEGLEANGVYEPGEPGIEAITLHLGNGACPSSGLATAVTDVNGSYSFGGLSAGTYCVSVDALSDGNDAILVPGDWTYPVRGANPEEVTLTLAADQHETDVDFGWDYQFLPDPPPLAATPTAEGYIVTALMNANCRTGPMAIFDQYGFLLEDEQAEAKGRLADNSWLSVKLATEPNQCWIAENLLAYSFDLNELPVLISPPTPTPAPGGISGIVWDDECNPPNLTPDTPEPPPPGCETDGIVYWANGIYEAGEQGIPNVIVQLGAGSCPSTGLPTTTTNGSGAFSFTGLAPGNYCVSISVVGNESALVPGTWSHPDVTGNWAHINVTVNPGATTGNVNFGWDFQF
jgi:hypothetical protein